MDTPDPRVDLAYSRTDMANYRTQLALDRTTLAWIRTTLTMASFGFALVGFFHTMRGTDGANERLYRTAVEIGIALIAAGAVAMLAAGVSHWRMIGWLRRNESLEVSRWPLSISLGILVMLITLGGLWRILA